jgi:hypothetical protein
MSTHDIRPGAASKQRRSQRVLLAVSLIVSGKQSRGMTFSERTHTLVVNAHGALMLLSEPVVAGQALKITNVATGEEMACTVVDSNPGQGGAAEVGIEFVNSAPRFWRVAFPPSDWTSRSPEAKRFQPAPTIATLPHPNK